MITVEQLYAGTREGLDIILSVYPQAEVCVSNPKAKFKARESERTPSAMLMATTDKNGNRVWKMIDYGDEGHALSPVDVWMKERGINRFGEAVLQIAETFNVRSDINKTQNRRALIATLDAGAFIPWARKPSAVSAPLGSTVRGRC